MVMCVMPSCYRRLPSVIRPAAPQEWDSVPSHQVVERTLELDEGPGPVKPHVHTPSNSCGIKKSKEKRLF
jgi:hypothetical protein